MCIKRSTSEPLLTGRIAHRCAVTLLSFWIGGKIGAKQRAPFLEVFWDPQLSDSRVLDLSRWKDRHFLALCNKTANFCLLCPAIRLLLLFFSLPLALWVFYCFQPALLFSLFQLSYSHLLIFTYFCLSLSLTICCLPTPSRHISISFFIYHLLCNVLI